MTTPCTAEALGFSMTETGGGVVSAETLGTPSLGERYSLGDIRVIADFHDRPNEAPHGLFATGIIAKTYRQVSRGRGGPVVLLIRKPEAWLDQSAQGCPSKHAGFLFGPPVAWCDPAAH